jgi:hypothetical protein
MSFRKLGSSHRLSVTCSGSELGQLYLSSPDQDAVRNHCDDGGGGGGDGDGDGRRGLRRGSSWLLRTADPYGRRRSFRRMSTYERFLDSDVMEDISGSEERIMFIEEETDECTTADNSGSDEVGGSTTMAKRGRSSSRRCRCSVWMLESPAVIVTTMMTLDLILGVSLSLYNSNLLRNVPGFRFPLCYALTQKLTRPWC